MTYVYLAKAVVIFPPAVCYLACCKDVALKSTYITSQLSTLPKHSRVIVTFGDFIFAELCHLKSLYSQWLKLKAGHSSPINDDCQTQLAKGFGPAMMTGSFG